MDWAAHPALLWLAAAAVLGVAEFIVPGVFLVFLAIAAAITGLAVAVLPGLMPVAQLAAFAVWSAVAVLIGRRWYLDYPQGTSDPLLNDRAGRLIGTVVTVADAIVGGHGRVRVGDGAWPASGPDADAGTEMRVVTVRDGVLTVAPLSPIRAIERPTTID